MHELTNATDKAAEDPQVRGDPLRTLFVARLSYDTEVKDLEREFGRYGPIERVRAYAELSIALLTQLCQIRIVENTHTTDPKNPKKTQTGYAFIVYEREKDMKGNFPRISPNPLLHVAVSILAFKIP